MTHWFMLGIAVMIMAEPCFSQQFQLDGRKTKGAVSFKLVRNLIIVPVYIDGRGPFDFILDSGVGPLIITDSLLVESFDIDHMPSYSLKGAGEAMEIEAYFSNQISARIRSASIDRIPTVFLKNDPLDLSSYLGIPIHGIMGSTFFHSFLVKVNYAHRRLRFYSFDARVKKKGRAIPISIHFRKPYLHATLTTEAEKTMDVLLLLDSGASHALSLETMDSKAFPLPLENISANLGIGLNGLISGKIGRINALRIGSFSFSEVLSAFPNFAEVGAKIDTPARNGTLGGEVLRRFTITYDYRDNMVYFKKNYHYNRPFEHDMSGMEVFVERGQTNRFFVGRVEENSPADSAGFQPYDEILSVNFKSVRRLTLDAIYDALRSGESKRLIFEINRNGERLYKMITLRKRI